MLGPRRTAARFRRVGEKERCALDEHADRPRHHYQELEERCSQLGYRPRKNAFPDEAERQLIPRQPREPEPFLSNESLSDDT